MLEAVYIAEKPDVGRELTSYLARKSGREPQKCDGYFLIPGVGAVTWARGHLMEMAQPDYYLLDKVKESEIVVQKGQKRVRWSLAHLPIIPERFVMLPSIGEPDKKKQFNVIGKLMKDAAVIYHCADKDREGQAIVDELLEHFKPGKNVKRIAFSALDNHSLETAFKGVCSNEDPRFRNMGYASVARSMADWLIGFNMTRAVSLCFGEFGQGVLTVGRVQTPTLAIVVKRHEDIQNFKPINYYVPEITLPDGTKLRWRRREGDDTPGIDSEGRIIDRALAQSIVDSINRGMEGIVSRADSKEKSTPPPLPYSLPALQKEMSVRHGLTVDQTTAAAQSLYQKKMQTYVGTDSRYLPESMHEDAKRVLSGLRSTGFKNHAENADAEKHYACWNDAKANPHHAIIPTGAAGKFDSDAERLVFETVTARYLAQFYPEYRYSETQLEANFGKDTFGATAKTPLVMGWKQVDEDTDEKDISKDEVNDLEMKTGRGA